MVGPRAAGRQLDKELSVILVVKAGWVMWFGLAFWKKEYELLPISAPVWGAWLFRRNGTLIG